MTTMTDDPHIAMIRAVEPRVVGACEDCIRLGTRWLHLRMCLTCGHMGCCDSSPMRHARQHALLQRHPIIRSAEPGENWRWCYFHEAFV